MVSLKELCYEKITTNCWYAKFSSFTIVVDLTTGYFNATKLCEVNRVNYEKWIGSHKTKKLMNSLRRMRAGYSQREGLDELSYEIRAGDSDTAALIDGTYICKEMLLDLTCWLSAEFYIKCSDVVLRHAERRLDGSMRQKDETIAKLSADLASKIAICEATISKIKKLTDSN